MQVPRLIRKNQKLFTDILDAASSDNVSKRVNPFGEIVENLMGVLPKDLKERVIRHFGSDYTVFRIRPFRPLWYDLVKPPKRFEPRTLSDRFSTQFAESPTTEPHGPMHDFSVVRFIIAELLISNAKARNFVHQRFESKFSTFEN